MKPLVQVFWKLVDKIKSVNHDENAILDAGFIHAAIIGADGSILEKSNGMDLKPSECSGIVLGFRNKAFPESIFFVGGKRYVVLKNDDRSLYGKLGSGGVVCVKTKTVILIGIYDYKLKHVAAANTVERLGDYLIDSNL
ncbi:hypothetical protein ACTFIV_004721 [Dictyostelium citrinum]